MRFQCKGPQRYTVYCKTRSYSSVQSLRSIISMNQIKMEKSQIEINKQSNHLNQFYLMKLLTLSLLFSFFTLFMNQLAKKFSLLLLFTALLKKRIISSFSLIRTFSSLNHTSNSHKIEQLLSFFTSRNRSALALSFQKMVFNSYLINRDNQVERSQCCGQIVSCQQPSLELTRGTDKIICIPQESQQCCQVQGQDSTQATLLYEKLELLEINQRLEDKISQLKAQTERLRVQLQEAKEKSTIRDNLCESGQERRRSEWAEREGVLMRYRELSQSLSKRIKTQELKNKSLQIHCQNFKLIYQQLNASSKSKQLALREQVSSLCSENLRLKNQNSLLNFHLTTYKNCLQTMGRPLEEEALKGLKLQRKVEYFQRRNVFLQNQLKMACKKRQSSPGQQPWDLTQILDYTLQGACFI